MTPAQLRTALAALLASQLGTYKTGNGTSMGAAIRVGNPPSDWVATGLEVIIDPSPEYANEPLHQHTAVATETVVRVIPRDSGTAQVAVTRICQRFETTNPLTIPANEALGILTQYTLRIKA